jgi:cellulose synthase/poly-beta-1,6-N-acetylglucosamine synthase-like glycosyltransferase
MNTLSNIFFILELALLIYLGFAAIYFFVFAFASLFYQEKQNGTGSKKYKIVVLIPSYKEDNVIIETAKSAMQHVSSRSQLEVIVIADSLMPETIKELKNTGTNVLPVSFEKSTKVKSMNKALNVIGNDYDYVVVLDADNIMEKDFIDKLINRLEQGYRIIQGHRTAKNSNTNFAVLDGISEEVNNSIFRKGHSFFGLSASVIGSGFICEFSLFKNLISRSTAVGGFDKEMELKLIEQKIRIGYANNALVYDEKIQHPDAFINQRRRWLSAQLIYCRKNLKSSFVQLFKYGNIDYFDKVIQYLLPPRIITLGITFAVAFFYLTFALIKGAESVSLSLYMWIGLFVLSSLSILISIPARMFGIRLLKSLWSLPKGFILFMFALIKVKGANKKFIHTAHGITRK